MEVKSSIRKARVFLMTINICFGSLYFGYNISTYNSLEQGKIFGIFYSLNLNSIYKYS